MHRRAGPVPRHAWGHRTLARACPSRYGAGGAISNAFARDRPSRYGSGNPYCIVGRGLSPAMPGAINVREGLSLALRGRRCYFQRVREGQALALRQRKPLLYRRAGPVPRHAWGHKRSRGPVPRATGPEVLFPTRSRGTGPRATGPEALFTTRTRRCYSRFGTNLSRGISLINNSLSGKLETLDKED